jgi:hypothetical protein
MPPVKNPLHEIGDTNFELLCRDLLEKEPDIDNCRKYEERGVAQHGADLIADDSSDGISTVIAQCKCYQDFAPTEITKAADKFLGNYDGVWKPFRIKRFILMVAADLIKANHHQTIQAEREKFFRHGIRFEVWDRAKILPKLGEDLIRRYFRVPEYWIGEIYGTAFSNPTPLAGSGAGITLDLQTIGQISALTNLVSETINNQLNEIRELQFRGLEQEALEKLEKIRKGTEWTILDAKVKGRILKSIGVIALSQTEGVKEAAALLNQAIEIDPTGNHTVFKAVLKHYEGDTQTALSLVADPANTDEFNLKVALNLELNKGAAAISLINDLPRGIAYDTETRRLHALALAATGQTEDAYLKIAAVEEDKLLWENVKTTKAIICYLSCLSPAYLPKRNILTQPEPTSWYYVKKDDESTLRLREAEKLFGQILAQGEKREDQRILFETWRLAALANNVEREQEAVDYCSELLKNRPTHPYALIWALARGFPVDFDTSRTALEEKLAGDLDFENSFEIDECLVLLNIYLKNNETGKAKKFLGRIKPFLKKGGGAAFGTYWQSRITVAEGNLERAIEYARLETNRNVGRQIKMMVLQEKYLRFKPRRKAVKPLVRHLEKCYRQTGEFEYLMELCLLSAERGHWRFVAEHSESLIERVQTAEAVRIASVALSKTGQPTRCLEILDNHADKFPQGNLPPELVNLRIVCHTQKGAFSAAVTEAERKFARDDSTTNLLSLVESQLQKGDLQAAAHSLRKLLSRTDVTPKQILRAARVAALEDADLAAKLWRTVKDDTLDDPELLSEALNIGYALGLEAESRELFKQMQIYAAKKIAPFGTFSLDKVLARTKAGNRKRGEVLNLYAKGLIPLHFLAKDNRATLADFLLAVPESNRRRRDLRRSSVLIRHGGRSVRHGFSIAADCALYMDESAFLMAADLGILEKVEQHFAPIFIPGILPHSLTTAREKLQRTQLSKIQPYRTVLKELEKNSFKLFPDDFLLPETDAQNLNGFDELQGEIGADVLRAACAAHVNEDTFAVVHLPLKNLRSETIELPEPLAENVVNCRTIVDSLFDQGYIVAGQRDFALEKLGGDGKQIKELAAIETGATLILTNYLVGALTEAGVLEKVCQVYKVFVEASYVERIRAEISAYEESQKLAERLRKLEIHLSEGFDKGLYAGVSVEAKQAEVTKSAENDDDLLKEPSTNGLLELLQLKPVEKSYVWIDDRNVNSFSTATGTPIVTVTDVLAKLRETGILPDEEYFAKLLLLRAGNFRYLPLRRDEIIYHLGQAKIIDGETVETDALGVLRRYTAACLLDEGVLQKTPPPGVPNANGEINFALEMTSAVTDALTDTWAKEEDVSVAIAKAEWIMNNLFAGKFVARRLIRDVAETDEGVYEIGLDIGELLVKALVIKGSIQDKNPKSRRELYFEWLTEYFIAPRIKADPEVVAAAARTISNLVSARPNFPIENKIDERSARWLYYELLHDLPGQIRGELELQQAVIDWLELKIEDTININNHSFPQAAFYRAAEKAVNENTEPAVLTFDTNETFRLKKLKAKDPGAAAIEVFDSANESAGIIRDLCFGVLPRDRSERLDFLRENRVLFDCRDENFLAESEEIAALLDPLTRVERVGDLKQRSMAFYYRNLAERVRETRKIHRSDFEKFSPAGLLNRYRLEKQPNSDSGFSEDIRGAVALLLKEESLETSLKKILHLPIQLPDLAIEKAGGLSAAGKTELLNDLIETAKSPLNKLHLANLILRTSASEEEWLERAGTLLSELYDENGKVDFDLFVAVLQIVEENFGYSPEISKWSSPLKLTAIWTHAGELFNIIKTYFDDPAGIANWLLSPFRQQSSEVFSTNSPYRNDWIYPRRVSRTTFLTHAVAKTLGGIDNAILHNLKLTELLRRAVLNDAETLPNHELFTSPELMVDSTDSIFGGDRATAIGNVADEIDLTLLSNASLREMVKVAVENLKRNQKDANAWATILLVVHDLPIFDEHRSDFADLAKNLDFTSILKENSETARFALNTVSAQLPVLPNEVREKCRNWVLELAGHFNKENVSEAVQIADNQKYALELLEVALKISLDSDDPVVTSRNFSSLAIEILNEWNRFGGLVKEVIEKLNLELPLSQTQHLSQLLLNIRAAE